ncbi:MAG TPA: GatB/YqeY domain-containing protein [Gammaproteobacteria bacterium]|nr:GatB/YqeY domain-containing protein [Gammaproteobacteria bacterium]
MTTSAIKNQIQEDMKTAMRSLDKERLATIRLILAALKQREVDERIVLTDEQVLAVLDKMLKQRRDSITQYEAGNRPDLAKKEAEEVRIIQTYLPAQLSDTEIATLIDAAIKEVNATSAKDMGKVMGVLKPNVQGRADVAIVSAKVKARLSI